MDDTTAKITAQIKAAGKKIGFELVGIAPAGPHDHLGFFRQWLEKGFAGTMEYLARRREDRADPRRLLPGAQSIICCGLHYYHGEPSSKEAAQAGHGWISRYAWGDDYHDVVLEKLGVLEDFIRGEIAAEAQLKSYVDTGPILERSYAASAGLGWIGKNTMLINRKVGSYFFLGEILTDLKLIPDTPEPDYCGHCTRCLDACPTAALNPYELDANKCISYLTIEHRGPIAETMQGKMGRHVVGCDICQEVCPWNQEIPLSGEENFRPRPGLFNPDLATLSELDETKFRELFKKSAIRRVKPAGLKRNVHIARQNDVYSFSAAPATPLKKAR